MRVRDALIADIEAGKYGPGDRIPSESELCATHGVAPMTARRAVRDLQARGMVYTEWGRGSFVVDPAEEDRTGEGDQGDA
ncbi:GntR family transcriptional regulator [Streptomyces uncialis]|uniref:GntR family transcriptional regulator n=1 Tax=Streptomyces uncialis TaxID=1048205 RepID=UPI00386768FB|nr:GntR family transcriptional regulator [Streptomyces uncialis]